MAAAFNFITCLQVPVITKEYDPNFIFVDIERDTIDVAGKLQDLFKTDTRQTGNFSDASGDTGNRSRFPRRQLGRKGIPGLLNTVKYFVKGSLQHFIRWFHDCSSQLLPF
jgi:hypothetical protein